MAAETVHLPQYDPGIPFRVRNKSFVSGVPVPAACEAVGVDAAADRRQAARAEAQGGRRAEAAVGRGAGGGRCGMGR